MVDMIEWRQSVIVAVANGMYSIADAFQQMTLLDVGVVLISVGVLAGLRQLYIDWRKKKGYRMVLRDRNDKAHALLTRVINDGLFEAECAGEISNKEVLALYAEMSKKLDLPDLVPKKHRLKIVKAELKKLRNSKDPEIVKARSHVPKIPGGMPEVIRRKKFAEYVGKFRLRKSA